MAYRGEYLKVNEDELLKFFLNSRKRTSYLGVNEMKETTNGTNMVGTSYFNHTIDTISGIQNPDSIWVLLSKRDNEDSDFSGSIILIKIDPEVSKPTVISVDDCFVNEVEFEASWRTSHMTFFDMREIFDHELLDTVESFVKAIKSCPDAVGVLNKRNDFLKSLAFIFGTRLDKKEEEKQELRKEIGELKAVISELKSESTVTTSSEMNV